MDKTKLGIICENLKWLDTEEKKQKDILLGILADLEELINRDGAIPAGEELWQLFLNIGDRSLRCRSFASLCSGLFASSQSRMGGALDIRSVSYVKSHTSDEAFDIFSEKLGGLSASYGSGFSAICEDVYYDRANACIMPLESNSDGLYITFRNLLMKYGLMIAAVCRIPTEDEGSLSLALLTSGMCDGGGNMYEVYFRDMTSEALCCLISVLCELGVSVTRVTSVESNYSGAHDHHMCFEVPMSHAASFEFCIDALFTSNLIIGKYKILQR